MRLYRTLYKDYDMSKIMHVDSDIGFFAELKKITEEENDAISCAITIEELQKTLHLCKDSAPGGLVEERQTYQARDGLTHQSL